MQKPTTYFKVAFFYVIYFSLNFSISRTLLKPDILSNERHHFEFWHKILESDSATMTEFKFVMRAIIFCSQSIDGIFEKILVSVLRLKGIKIILKLFFSQFYFCFHEYK